MTCLSRLILCLASVAGLASGAGVAAGAATDLPAPRGVFAAGAHAAEIEIESREQRAFVRARAGGATLTLLVDPAATSVMSPEAARRLGLAIDPGGEAPVARVPELALGGYAVRDLPFFVIELGRWPASETGATDGVLGAEAFAQVMLTFDHAARRMTVAEPAAFVAPKDVARLPLRYVDGAPLALARIDGFEGEFLVEPGARLGLVLHAGFVRDHGLIDRYPNGHESVLDWTLAGPLAGRATRVGVVELGGARFEGVVAGLQLDEGPRPGRRPLAGHLGGALFARAVVTWDLARRELLIAPVTAPADPFDRSGMWLNLDGEDLIIDALLPNGPGARAQLQPSDRIVSVDGVPATQLTLAGLRRLLATAPAGQRVKITARRDAKVVNATVVLADLVPPAPPAATAANR